METKDINNKKNQEKASSFVNFMNAIPKAVLGWINALMGKGSVSPPKSADASPTSPIASEAVGEEQRGKKVEGEFIDELHEDSVVKDLESFKRFTKKKAEEAEKKLKPILSKVEKHSDKYLDEAKEKMQDIQAQMQEKKRQNIGQTSQPVGANFPNPVRTKMSPPIKKAAIGILIVGVLLITVAIFVRMFSGSGEENGEGQITVTVTPEASIDVPVPRSNSIYATDPEVLQIEENINVLDGEMSRTLLKETRLNPPPTLDFDVKF